MHTEVPGQLGQSWSSHWTCFASTLLFTSLAQAWQPGVEFDGWRERLRKSDEEDLRFDRIIRSGGESFHSNEEEDRFSRILRRSPSDPEPSQKRLVDLETLRGSMSRMVCRSLPDPRSCDCRLRRLMGPKLQFYRVILGENVNGEKEDSEPGGFQEVFEDTGSGGLGFKRFRRSLREEREQRATQGAWSPMGKRSKDDVIPGHRQYLPRVSRQEEEEDESHCSKRGQATAGQWHPRWKRSSKWRRWMRTQKHNSKRPNILGCSQPRRFITTPLNEQPIQLVPIKLL